MTLANRMAISSENGYVFEVFIQKSSYEMCDCPKKKYGECTKSADIALIITEYLEPSPKPKNSCNSTH